MSRTRRCPRRHLLKHQPPDACSRWQGPRHREPRRSCVMTARDLSPFGGMIATLTKKWWIFLVQGILMILLAVLAFTQPTLLISAIGAYVAIDGAGKLFSAFGEQNSDQSRWPALLIG